MRQFLELKYTGPDTEFIQLNENIRYASVNPTEAEVAIEQADRKKVYSYVRSLYEPYFTESGLENFMTNMGAYLRHHQNAKEVPTSIEEMDVKQSEIKTASNQYHFTVMLHLKHREKEGCFMKYLAKQFSQKKERLAMLLREKLNEINNSR